mgnify:CR=1 FL=1
MERINFQVIEKNGKKNLPKLNYTIMMEKNFTA